MNMRTLTCAVWGIGALALAASTGCATTSGSVGGRQSLPEERVAATPVKEIDPDDRKSSLTSSRTASSLSLQPIGRGGASDAASDAGGYLLDVPFDFDRAALRQDAVVTVEANAERLKEHSAKRILLEGRGDEVGTSEYNLVLGERRARSVKRYLEDLGLDTSKIETTSYGKDHPLCLQHSTDCWQKNRSVHFIAGD